MATWTFKDGTKLKSGGVVTGDGEFADYVREWVRDRRGVQCLPHPCASTPLDPSSDFMLDLLARQAAGWRGGVVTKYKSNLDDAPPALRKQCIAMEKAMRRAPPGIVY